MPNLVSLYLIVSEI